MPSKRDNEQRKRWRPRWSLGVIFLWLLVFGLVTAWWADHRLLSTQIESLMDELDQVDHDEASLEWMLHSVPGPS